MGFGDYLSGAFPGVRITSSKRDPNSALGRANPKSFHNVGMAWDVAPIPGMTFDQYKSRVEQDGWNVREAIDEVNHPSKHATGPHWHMAVDGRKEQQPMAGTSLADLMRGNPALQPPQQPQPPSLASYLQTPLTNEAIQPAQMPNPSTGFVEMAPLPGVKPRTWGEGGKGWQIMGIIGDAMQAASGGQPSYMPYVQHQQELETEGRRRLAEQQARRQEKLSDRAATLQDWVFQQDYQRGHPEATQDERTLAWWKSLSPEDQATFANMQDVRSPITVSGPTGVHRVARSYGMSQGGGGNLRAEAEAAIAAGANPETVWARYREMGGQ